MAKRWGINREKLFTYAREGAYQAVYGTGGAFEKMTDPNRTEEDVRTFVKKLADLDAIDKLLEDEQARKEAPDGRNRRKGLRGTKEV